MKKMRNPIKFLIHMAFAITTCSIYANETKTMLLCSVTLDSWVGGKQHSANDPVEFELLIISKPSNEIEVQTPNTSYIGISTFFSTEKYYQINIANIENYSSQEQYYFKYNRMQPDGKIYSKNTFRLSRYTGDINVEYTSDTGTARSKGKCKVLDKKLF